MNIYLIIEDGQHKCWQAMTMTLALDAAKGAYLDERKADEGDAFNLSEELTFYEDSVLESCNIIAELGNP